MAITPQTNLFLLKCPLTLNNKNQLTFTNATTQFNYFNSLPKLEVEKISYQRKDNIIRYPAHIDKIIQYNYCMYQNSNYGNKWFYAYITDMKYDNDNLTYITIATDVFQTWQFDLNYKRSFIEREHLSVSDDIPGANLIPEGLETGEVKINNSSSVTGLVPAYVLATSIRSSGNTEYSLNGIVSGLNYYIGNAKGIIDRLKSFYSDGNSDKILVIFTVPALAVLDYLNSYLPGISYSYDDFKASSSKSFSIEVSSNFKVSPYVPNIVARPTSIDGYTPRNKKLLTYPYLYLGVTPYNGTSKIFKYENFTNGQPGFKIISEVNPNPSVVIIPTNYNGDNENVSEAITMQGYPQISWIQEYFSSWIAQNSQIINLSMDQEQFNYEVDSAKRGIQGAMEIAKESFSLDILGAAEAGANLGFDLGKMDVNHEYYIRQQMAQIEKQKLIPNTAHMGTSATAIGYELINNDIFIRYSIKKQFAEKIDQYFDMYGYITNSVKVPNINNRPNWNYVKTIGCNIAANIPQMDLAQIKNMFDNGITLWHNTNTFLDYSQNNR